LRRGEYSGIRSETFYRPNVQVPQEIYVFSNARATANF
jgi:hypothetical protein